MIEQVQKTEKWYQNSILFKLGVITLLILLLLIPQSWIQDLIVERQANQTDNINIVSNKWSGSQLVQGPILMLPYKRQVSNAGSKAPVQTVIEYLYVLPQNLNIEAGLNTELYKKGLVDVTVYNTKVLLKGNFSQPDLQKANLLTGQVMYDKARLIFGITDLKGLKNNPAINVQGQIYNAEPLTEQSRVFENAMQISFVLPQTGNINFNYVLDIKGSNDLNFLHIGKTTDVELAGNWKSPEFNGRDLPDNRVVNEKGFKAKWHLLYYNRPFPQQWANNDTTLSGKKAHLSAQFGVRLQVPVGEYRKITRTAKYATLIILLTFVSLFLTELIRKQRIHLFNYTLIGAAMIVYYTLLLSFAEKIGYNYAYLISSISTIGLISLFTASLLKNVKAAVLFSIILTVFYTFIFVIIQLEDYALMVGSIALFVIVAALMYFSRKINWDNH
ncbi:cell envelope integrity protein CreD [Mucilaginibacter glaciei]|uniref:Cell envelope integrity protein CreD n=1 Tax=Mucilaginibacter glaciei TaxID=2772109 RepID=A0A926NPT9_9SPHI|nr:cell envelope integrity protein CreD [Mucilaginibacter glaciei]MBD1392852.1 cell envelope integrity protein CreD [Mucilaginibacter glaciei]